MDNSSQIQSFVIPIVIVFVVVFFIVLILRCYGYGSPDEHPTTNTAGRIATLENGQVIVVPSRQRVMLQPTAPPISSRRPIRRSVSNEPSSSVNSIGSAYNLSEDLPPSYYDVVTKPSPRY